MTGSHHNAHWRQNLYVCLFGSFTTIIAMTLILPFLPLYVEQLGVRSPSAIVQWSGVAFGVTFLAASLVSPIWGRLADRYGRKLMLVRASLGMAIVMSLIGLAHNIYELIGLRLAIGLAGGYASGSVILVAMQTPKERSTWALGTLSIGVMAGSFVGPLLGGILPGLIGLRETFFAAGAAIFVAFLATCFLIREERVARPPAGSPAAPRIGTWAAIPDRRPVFAMLATALMLMFANMSIEPIITVYVAQLVADPGRIALMSGLVMAASALASILAAPRVGRLADRIGAWPVVIGCLVASGLLLIPQAFVTDAWQLVALRFLMGLALAGLLPSVTALIRHSVPDGVTGGVLGYSQSAQYMGQITGPLVGGFAGAQFGMRSVFFATSALMLCGAALNWMVFRNLARPAPDTAGLGKGA
ncbi:MAG: major facilitator superfamily 1 [Rhodospirillales bacterium]|nr:major facilitator superfamily 1 [Rhodospirillales bacterium]